MGFLCWLLGVYCAATTSTFPIGSAPHEIRFKDRDVLNVDVQFQNFPIHGSPYSHTYYTIQGRNSVELQGVHGFELDRTWSDTKISVRFYDKRFGREPIECGRIGTLVFLYLKYDGQREEKDCLENKCIIIMDWQNHCQNPINPIVTSTTGESSTWKPVRNQTEEHPRNKVPDGAGFQNNNEEDNQYEASVSAPGSPKWTIKQLTLAMMVSLGLIALILLIAGALAVRRRCNTRRKEDQMAEQLTYVELDLPRQEYTLPVKKQKLSPYVEVVGVYAPKG